MSLPEGYLPRKGDELLIRVRVKYDTEPGDDCYVDVVGQEYIHLFLPVSYIYALHRRRWNEGDKVISLEFDGPGTVLATFDDWVWVICADGPFTTPSNGLEHYVEDAPQKPCAGDIGSQSLVGDDDPIL